MSTLDVSFNRLTALKRYGLTGVGRLDVSYNILDQVDDDALAGLERPLAELDLGDSKPRELDRRLVELYLGHARPQGGSVEQLDLVDSRPRRLVRPLVELDLGYNRLTHVGATVLRHARSLLLLDLRHNYLGPKFGVYSSPAAAVAGSSPDPGDLNSFASPSYGNLFQVISVFSQYLS